MNKSTYILIFMLVLIMMLNTIGCRTFIPLERPSMESDLPKNFSLYSESREHASRWWEELDSSELNSLINEVLSQNLSLKQSLARLEQSKALLVQKGSSLYPTLNFTTSPGRQSPSLTASKTTIENDLGAVAGPGQAAVTDPETEDHSSSEYYSLGLTSSYELDLWGRIKADQESSRLDLMASREDLNTMAYSLAAQVTETWINIIAQRIQMDFLERQLELNKAYLSAVELRFQKGMVSALDVYQQQQVIEQVKARIPLLEAQKRRLLNGLAILLGKPPLYPIEITENTLPIPEDIPAAGIPADLLANRPDIRAAGLRLEAADWQVAVARANRLPTISISASASYGADKIGLVFDNWALNLAGNLMAPILDGGRRAAEVDRTEAVVDEKLLAYKETVLNAIKEVEDALINEEKQREHLKALEKQISVSQKALDEAIARYRKGLNEYLPVLNQILSVQNLELDLIQKRAQLIIYRVNLYRALGGPLGKIFPYDVEDKSLS